MIVNVVSPGGPDDAATRQIDEALAQGYRVVDVISTPSAAAMVVVTTVLSMVPQMPTPRATYYKGQ